jgi:metallo-beta-lactamase family protein
VGEMRSMSAHGDYEDLLQYVSCQDPKLVKQIFLVHGEYKVQQIFRDYLVKKGFEVSIPERHQEVTLS